MEGRRYKIETADVCAPTGVVNPDCGSNETTYTAASSGFDGDIHDHLENSGSPAECCNGPWFFIDHRENEPCVAA